MIQSVQDKAIIKPFPKHTHNGSIVIPTEARVERNEGVIVSCMQDDNLKDGDTVVYDHNAGAEFELDGQMYLSIKKSYIQAKIEQGMPRVLFNYFIVEPIKQTEVVNEQSGLIENVIPLYDKGTVIHVGSGTNEMPMQLKVGDTVNFQKGAGSKTAYGTILSQTDFLFID